MNIIAALNKIPAKTRINPNLKETIINPDANELPATHLGWNGRLNGPADNPESSCMSCHMTAQYPVLYPASPLFLPEDQRPAVGSTEWREWFRSLERGTLFNPDSKPTENVYATDNSLQLSQSLMNFHKAHERDVSTHSIRRAW